VARAQPVRPDHGGSPRGMRTHHSSHQRSETWACASQIAHPILRGFHHILPMEPRTSRRAGSLRGSAP
jgi:hypothetical protein